jgi:hypothetical protein
MIIELTKITLGIAVITGGWLLIDLLWQRMFGSDNRRTGCHGCTCSTPCATAGQTDTDNTDLPGEQ